MINSLISFGTNPVYPMVLGALLYVWIGVALVVTDKPYFGGMWFAYAFANAFLVLHSLTGR